MQIGLLLNAAYKFFSKKSYIFVDTIILYYPTPFTLGHSRCKLLFRVEFVLTVQRIVNPKMPGGKPTQGAVCFLHKHNTTLEIPKHPQVGLGNAIRILFSMQIGGKSDWIVLLLSNSN